MTKGDLLRLLEKHGYKRIEIIEPAPMEAIAIIGKGRLFKPKNRAIAELREKRPLALLLKLRRQVSVLGRGITLWEGIV